MSDMSEKTKVTGFLATKNKATQLAEHITGNSLCPAVAPSLDPDSLACCELSNLQHAVLVEPKCVHLRGK